MDLRAMHLREFCSQKTALQEAFAALLAAVAGQFDHTALSVTFSISIPGAENEPVPGFLPGGRAPKTRAARTTPNHLKGL